MPVYIELLPLGRRLVLNDGDALHDALFDHGVEFPCGGKGRCKGCRVRVIEGDLPIHEEERQRFSSSELTAGWRLACLAKAHGNLKIELAQWESAVLGDNSAFHFMPSEGSGIAVDIGTTTIAAQLLDLRTADVLAVSTGLNSQAQHGADIMSRLEYAVSMKGQESLQSLIRGQIGDMIRQMLEAARDRMPPLRQIVLVGNTVMHHLFCGLDVEPLSRYPFEPADAGEQNFRPGEFGWDIDESVVVRFLPCLGGFVGSDILAGILATKLHESSSLSALMDLGTNGEIVVGTRNQLLCASTAAGPAFEGARISMGMRAATGAISEVSADAGVVTCRTLGGVEPRGICGSGLVDAIATGRQLAMIRPNGRLTIGEVFPLKGDVSLSQWDIRELQMAKGAIAAGLKILLRAMGAGVEDLHCLYLAGAFGNYINLSSGRSIGLLKVPLERIQPSGNTALLGAKIALCSSCKGYSQILEKTRHVSLHETEGFQDIYVDEMAFP